VPKARKYRCCIRIVRDRAKENGQAKLVLFIKRHQVEASQKHTALLACLHKNQGHIVSYKQLGLILGHKSARTPELHILRQYVLWINRAHMLDTMLRAKT